MRLDSEKKLEHHQRSKSEQALLHTFWKYPEDLKKKQENRSQKQTVIGLSIKIPAMCGEAKVGAGQPASLLTALSGDLIQIMWRKCVARSSITVRSK